MLQLNLLHEQQKIQREKDFDPIRLTVLAGVVIVLSILLWGAIVYMKMSGLRNELSGARESLKTSQGQLKAMGTLTDLPKVLAQAQSLQNRIDFRPLLASNLDILRDVIPLNCQVKSIKTAREIKVFDFTVQGKKGPIVTKMKAPALDLILEIHTEAKSKVEVLQIRDSVIEALHREPRLEQFISQVPNEDGTTNWNEVVVLTNLAPDPKPGQKAIGIFEIKLPLFLKDKPKDLVPVASKIKVKEGA